MQILLEESILLMVSRLRRIPPERISKDRHGQKWSGRLRNGLGVKTSTITSKVHVWESKTSKPEFSGGSQAALLLLLVKEGGPKMCPQGLHLRNLVESSFHYQPCGLKDAKVPRRDAVHTGSQLCSPSSSRRLAFVKESWAFHTHTQPRGGREEETPGSLQRAAGETKEDPPLRARGGVGGFWTSGFDSRPGRLPKHFGRATEKSRDR